MIIQAVRVGTAALICTVASSVFAQGAGEDFTALNCGACHGGEGQGSALGPSIATGELTTADFIGYVRNPTGSMPAHNAETVSDQALAEMHATLVRAVGASKPPSDAERGALLYRQTGCYQCHANEGQGGAQGPRIGPDPLTLARFTWYVRNPSGAMPPYTDAVMTDQDLADIHAFLESRTQPPAVGDIPLLAP